MNKKEFFNAMVLCDAESSRVITLFNLVDRYEDHITRIKISGKTMSDINNDITLESLEYKRDKAMLALMNSFYALNGAYRKITGKYLCGKMDKSITSANKIYDMLLACV